MEQLPAPFVPLAERRQFVTYRLVPSSRPNKTDKLPLDWRTGRMAPKDSGGHMSPEYRCTYAEAVDAVANHRGDGVGFVFTEDDPYFFLDIDNCLQPDRQWSPLAVDLCKRFAGAAVEVSQSGNGLHIIGRYSGAMPEHACKNIPLGLELYHTARFVALTGRGLVGNVGHDCTAQLAELVPQYFAPGVAVAGAIDEWTSEPVPEWSGPADDDDLIRRALTSGGRSAAAAFGGEGVTFADLWEANADALARRWPGNTDGYGASEADAALAAHLAFWTGKDCERIRRLMYRSGLVREKWELRGEYYLPRTIIRACGVSTEVAKGKSDLEKETERRRKQQAENIEIGEGSDTIPTATICTLDEMLADFVLIKDGSQVAPVNRPQAVLSLADFRNSMAASIHNYLTPEGKPKTAPVTKFWLTHPQRMEAEALTFRAGGPRMTTEPGTGKNALNLWTPPYRADPPPDWPERSRSFVEHVAYLWGEDASAFLDWLAQIEQQPGILPHYGWVHISRQHGKGRNWVSSVLARVWRGYVAASLDLAPILDGGFNGRISRKLLGIVDEINEGGHGSYHHAQKLRQIVTEEHRDINPKYGRQRVEHNACRWLMFSNHTGALPLTDEDRRFWVVSHNGPAGASEYYAELYGKLSDPTFIASVAEFLRQRDLRNFKPGQRPPMTQAKSELIAFNQTDEEKTLKAIVARWPVDLISAAEITRTLGSGNGPSAPAVRHAMDRAGMRRLSRKLRVRGDNPQPVYAIRHFEQWEGRDAEVWRTEIARVADAEKDAAIGE